ncbi:MAG: hypothetical protein HPY50_15465 [Firmicutes bacterium]|nr:hypothetical protein [Bacillota bacterium]
MAVLNPIKKRKSVTDLETNTYDGCILTKEFAYAVSRVGIRPYDEVNKILEELSDETYELLEKLREQKIIE